MIMSGSFLPSLWSSTNHSLLGSKEPALLCNHVDFGQFHLSGYRVLSNDAGRCKRFYFLFFLPTNTPFLPHANRVSLAAFFDLFVSPQPARALSASSIRCGPPNISSVTIDHDELCDLPAGRRVA